MVFFLCWTGRIDVELIFLDFLSQSNKKIKETGSVIIAKCNYKKIVRFQKNINCVKHTMTRNLQKSSGRLSCQLSMIRTPCQRMLKYMKMRAFKLTTLSEIKGKFSSKCIIRNSYWWMSVMVILMISVLYDRRSIVSFKRLRQLLEYTLLVYNKS